MADQKFCSTRDTSTTDCSPGYYYPAYRCPRPLNIENTSCSWPSSLVCSCLRNGLVSSPFRHGTSSVTCERHVCSLVPPERERARELRDLQPDLVKRLEERVPAETARRRATLALVEIFEARSAGGTAPCRPRGRWSRWRWRAPTVGAAGGAPSGVRTTAWFARAHAWRRSSVPQRWARPAGSRPAILIDARQSRRGTS